ncbi:MAG: hypothetical protein JSW06_02690 [Thermoplasmatales archaeon]|nr:MAG: hypothetical protein JSW06_02690 [Thermoplasmatales archaeon]
MPTIEETLLSIERKLDALTSDIDGDITAINSIITDSDGDQADIIETNGHQGLVALAPGHVSTKNSTTNEISANILNPGAVYTGEWEDVTNFGVIVVTVKASHASVTDGLVLQFSSDGTNIDSTDEFTIAAITGKTFSFQAAAKYFRVKYTNGPSTQTYFRLQTLLKPYYVKPSSHRISDSISPEDDAELTKAVLTALNSDGTFENIGATASNNLKVANVEDGLAIAKGEVEGTSFIHKFGSAPDFDTGDNRVTIWDGADDGDIAQMPYQYSTIADIDSVSSSENADTQDIEIQGLNTDYEIVTQTVTLSGQTRVALATSLIRVFRMKNVDTSDNAGHIYCYVNTTLSGGVPVDTTKVRAVIQPGNNQTLMAVYTIPAGHTGYMRDWYASTSGGSRDSNYIIDLFARPFGQVFQIKHKSSISDSGNSYIQHVYEEPEVFAEKTDIELRATITAAAITGASISGGFDIVLVEN